MQRLPPLAGRRQQRLAGAGADAGHQLRQLHRPLRLGRRGRGRPRGRRGDRVGRAAGGDRQQPAPPRLSRTNYAAPPRRTTASCRRPTTIHGPTSEPQRRPSLQLRGEYLYTANGAGGLRVFDVANIDNKGFSERIITAPVSPLGQHTYVDTKFATAVALPTNMPMRLRSRRTTRRTKSSRCTRSIATPTSPTATRAWSSSTSTRSTDGDPHEQLPRARRHVQSRRASSTARAHHHRRRLRLRRSATPAWWSSTSTIRSHPRVVAELGAPDLDRPARDRGPVPLRLRRPTRRASRCSTSPTRRSRASAASLPIRRGRATSTWRGPMPTSPAGSQGLGDRRRRAAERSRARSDLQRRRRASNDTRSVRVGTTNAQRLRLRRRRQERPARRAADLARRDARALRLQPAADAAADRDLPHARPGARALEGPRPRPRRRRERQPGSGLRPPRRAAVQPRRDARALHARRPDLHGRDTAPGRPSKYVRPERPQPGTEPGAPAVQPLAPVEERRLPGRR